MAAAIGVRSDHTSEDLRRLTPLYGDPDQVRRLLAIALNLDGGSKVMRPKLPGGKPQIVRDWVLRFNTDRPDGLATRKTLPRKRPQASALTVTQQHGIGWANHDCCCGFGDHPRAA